MVENSLHTLNPDSFLFTRLKHSRLCDAFIFSSSVNKVGKSLGCAAVQCAMIDSSCCRDTAYTLLPPTVMSFQSRAERTYHTLHCCCSVKPETRYPVHVTKEVKFNSAEEHYGEIVPHPVQIQFGNSTADCAEQCSTLKFNVWALTVTPYHHLRLLMHNLCFVFFQ